MLEAWDRRARGLKAWDRTAFAVARVRAVVPRDPLPPLAADGCLDLNLRGAKRVAKEEVFVTLERC